MVICTVSSLRYLIIANPTLKFCGHHAKKQILGYQFISSLKIVINKWIITIGYQISLQCYLNHLVLKTNLKYILKGSGKFFHKTKTFTRFYLVMGLSEISCTFMFLAVKFKLLIFCYITLKKKSLNGWYILFYTNFWQCRTSITSTNQPLYDIVNLSKFWLFVFVKSF